MSWRSRLRALWNPDMYHGWGKTRNYFEGWYVKVVDPTEEYALAVIPGISKGKDGHNHSFIQLLDGKQCKTFYHEFEEEAFVPSPRSFDVELKGNRFGTTQMILDLPEVKGQLAFEELFHWPKMLGAPGIMGWYSFVPFMECYHGVVSVNHRIRGQLEVYGKKVDFTNGKGYMEKDWGKSFPSAWIWTQTNHFDEVYPVSLMASVANIPWLGSSFVGYIVGFLLGDRLFRFATYTGAKMKAEIKGNEVQVGFKDNRYRLEIKAHKAEGGNLISPISGNMVGKVNESLQAEIEVRFFEKEQLIFEGVGRNAGLEVAGDVDTLLSQKWRR
jgi:tocopherol cyclase